MSSMPETRRKRTTKRVVKPKRRRSEKEQNDANDTIDALYMRFFEDLMDSKRSLMSAHAWNKPSTEDRRKFAAHRHNTRELLVSALKTQISLLRLLCEEDKTDEHFKETLRYIFNISVKLGVKLEGL